MERLGTRCQGDGEHRDGAERMESPGMMCMEDGGTGNGVMEMESPRMGCKEDGEVGSGYIMDGQTEDARPGGWRAQGWGRGNGEPRNELLWRAHGL